MARPQAADYAEKRAAITAAAARLFARHGYAGAPIAELAAACGLSKSLLYHYYGSKDAILFAVMDGHMAELLEVVDTPPAADLAPVDAWRAFAEALLTRYAGAADSQKVLLYDLDHLAADRRAEIVARQRRLIAAAEAKLAAAAADIAGADTAAAGDKAKLRAQVMLFFGMINWSHTWFDPAHGLSRAELARQAADTALKGLTP